VRPSTPSTWRAAASVVARLLPTGSSCRMDSALPPPSSRKLVSSRVPSSTVPASTARPMPTVAQRRVVAKSMTGR
jgi:hypothetical protein